jgi:hypothetical protein
MYNTYKYIKHYIIHYGACGLYILIVSTFLNQCIPNYKIVRMWYHTGLLLTETFSNTGNNTARTQSYCA